MTPRLYDSDGDDCASALDEYRASLLPPPVTLSPAEVERLMATLKEADGALAKAAGSKMYRIRLAALTAREKVIDAWARLDAAIHAARKAARAAERNATNGDAA